MAAPAPSLSMSMRMTVYGISKKFPTIRNITCEQLNNWIEDESKKLVCLVSLDLFVKKMMSEADTIVSLLLICEKQCVELFNSFIVKNFQHCN